MSAYTLNVKISIMLHRLVSRHITGIKGFVVTSGMMPWREHYNLVLIEYHINIAVM